MAYNIPTTKELKESHLTRLEGQIGQDAPTQDKAYLRVQAATEAALDIGLYKYAADAVKQNLALTATADGLDRIGIDNNTPRKLAVAAIIEADLPATTGTVIPVDREFVSDSNGLRYRTTAAVTAVAGTAALTLKCAETGTSGNLDAGETLSIVAQVAGAETTATMTGTDTLGTNRESDTDYRPRVLFAQIAVTGGGNATDHKLWAEAVAGVRRAFPYSGRPEAEGDSYPGDRTVYVEATTAVDSDGIAPAALLAAVRSAINTDPDTGESRTLLGLTDDTLFIQSIIRTSIFVDINNLDVSAEDEASLKSDIEDALDFYFRMIAPFVDGVDVAQERNDTITTISVSEVVQDVLSSYGASAQTITFGLVLGVSIPLYFLNPGELAKLGGVTYA